MSKTVACPKCGEPMDVPAYPGDGVYTKHTCRLEGWEVERRKNYDVITPEIEEEL